MTGTSNPVEYYKNQEATYLHNEGIDDIYARKCALVNECLQKEIGFGRYQFQLFMLTGLGWFADNLWLQGLAVVLPQVQQELRPTRIEFATLALYVGLIIGATTWGVLADLIGRRLSFNITLFLAAVFGLSAGAAPNFVTFAALVACMGFGTGGNLPVDGAVYLEHIPQSHQWTLTLLSAWWAVGQLVASVVAWGFIGNFSCPATSSPCQKADNMGWRYTFYTLGSLTFLMFFLRFVVFDLQESSKYLIAKHRDEEALEVLRHIARRNGKEITLTLDHFAQIQTEQQSAAPRTMWKVIKSSFSNFSLSHVRPLFAGKRFAINSTITIVSWGLIGLAYPLFNGFLPLYLNSRVAAGDSSSSTNVAYRNYVIISVMGIPGSLVACLVVDWTRKAKSKKDVGSSPEESEAGLKPRDAQSKNDIENGSNGDHQNEDIGYWGFGGLGVLGGRKATMALSTLLTGIFLFLFTTSKDQGDVLGYSCASGFTQNAMYGVLYAYTPEVFPAPHRGTGDALASSFNRVTGLLAPIIKIATTTATGEGSNSTANSSVFVSATLLTATAFLMMFLPIETAGRAAM